MKNLKCSEIGKMAKVLKELEERGQIEKDEYGEYFVEIYTGYDDIPKDSIVEIIKNSDSYEEAADRLRGDIEESYYIYTGLSDLLDRDVVNELADKYEIEDIYYELSEYVYMYVDVERILSRTTLDLNIYLSTYNESNHDYTFIDNGFYEDTGLNWFVEQQTGLTVNDILKKDKEDMTNFEKAVASEVYNVINSMNVFTIFVEITGYELLEFLESRSFGNNKKLSITIKDANAGLVDFWNGGGSVLEMFVDKELTLDADTDIDVFLEIDGTYNYGVREIYGGIDRRSDITIEYKEEV